MKKPVTCLICGENRMAIINHKLNCLPANKYGGLTFHSYHKFPAKKNLHKSTKQK